MASLLEHARTCRAWALAPPFRSPCLESSTERRARRTRRREWAALMVRCGGAKAHALRTPGETILAGLKPTPYESPTSDARVTTAVRGANRTSGPWQRSLTNRAMRVPARGDCALPTRTNRRGWRLHCNRRVCNRSIERRASRDLLGSRVDLSQRMAVATRAMWRAKAHALRTPRRAIPAA